MAAAPQSSDDRSPEAVLGDFASEILEMCSGDFDEAEKQLRLRMKRERSKWGDLAITFTAAELIRLQRLKIRTNIANAQAPKADRGLRSLKDEFALHYKRYANWPLSSGKLLSKASKEDVTAEAAFYRTQGRTMMARADWFSSIASKMGEAKEVAAALDPKTIYELHQEAEAKWTE